MVLMEIQTLFQVSIRGHIVSVTQAVKGFSWVLQMKVLIVSCNLPETVWADNLSGLERVYNEMTH